MKRERRGEKSIHNEHFRDLLCCLFFCDAVFFSTFFFPCSFEIENWRHQCCVTPCINLDDFQEKFSAGRNKCQFSGSIFHATWAIKIP